MSFDWEEGDKAQLCLKNMKMKLEETSDGRMIYNADEGRMTHRHRHIVFPNADDLKKCLSDGPNIFFIVESKSKSSNPGDPTQGAVPKGGFSHTYWHVKPGTVFSATKANAEDKNEDEEDDESLSSGSLFDEEDEEEDDEEEEESSSDEDEGENK